MPSTGASGAAPTPSGSEALDPSAAENSSSPALGSTAATQPAYSAPLDLYQQNPYMLALVGIRPGLTTEDVRAIATYLRAISFVRVDSTLCLTYDGQIEYLAAWVASRNEEFRRRVGDASRPFLALGVGTVSEAFLPRDVDLLSQQLESVSLADPVFSRKHPRRWPVLPVYKLKKLVFVATKDGDTAVLSYAPLDPAAIEASCRSTKDGAVVSFVGYTRDEFQGRTVTRLTYESYVPLALRTLQQILVEARALPPPPPAVFPGLEDHRPCCGDAAPGQHPAHQHDHTDAQRISTPVVEVSRIRVAHLLGESPPLTPSICISVASPHRREAFYVCEWVLEAVKRKAQVWKREWYASETTDGEEEESFVGRDGEGPHGRGGRAHQDSKWKENFPPPTSA